MSNSFDSLLDRHLTLSERIRQPNPEQAVTEIEGLVADMDAALDAGSITGPSARRIALLSGTWRSHLALANLKPLLPRPTWIKPQALRSSISYAQCRQNNIGV